ncbi:DUF722 domain-containing protein [Weissella paramesenteroides]|uniref:DUF722 domain-containing protein n=1 Tax=Weissella paramesenteroides TaxID=1249 RepID=A0ABD4XGS8_WEIPA|nr:DUF722 domain-containing protein [Weissella paramesenteroides]MDF8368297.1 DUF722 domain-containing protein [Weissella paramesenteroides]MDF8370514.1 DUF722 domain-containing protein [Weissella paramesenteroides]
MADKLDKLLSDYFTGILDANIKLRRAELKYFSKHAPDENIGGGRKQNDYSNPVELDMIREEDDEMLSAWIMQKEIIETFFNITVEPQRTILYERYGHKKSWLAISLIVHANERTCQRWRDNFKNGIAGHLYSTLNGMSF